MTDSRTVPLVDVVTIVSGFAFASERFSESGDLPVVRIRDVVPGYSQTYYTGDYQPKYLVTDGALLVGMDGEFNCGVWAGGRALLNQRVCKVEVRPERMDSGYLRYLLPGVVKSIEARTPHSTVKHLSAKQLEAISVPLPPLAEQRRIAALLDRADAIRRKRQQAIRLADDLLRSAFLDMFGDLVTNPRGWKTKRLGTLITDGPQNGLYRPATDYGTGTPIVRIDSFSDGEIRDLQGLKRVRLDAETAASFRLAESEILINRVNAPNLVGKSAIVPQLSEPTVFESNMMRLRVDARFILPEFLVAQLQTPYVRRQIFKGTKDAVNQSSINQDDVRSFEVRVPPLDTQQRFLEVKRRALGLRMQLRESLQESSFLFASLVHRAFLDSVT